MSRLTLSRRTVLRGLLGGGAVVVGLPPLELFFDANGTRGKDGSPMPKRFGLFFWGNGVVPQKWTPIGEGPGWRPSELLAPLAPHVDVVTVVTGTRVLVPNVEPHTSGAAGLLTGAGVKKQGDHSSFAQATIDQQVAVKAGLGTRFRSVEFGARPGGGNSFNGPDNRNPPETSPRAFFDRLFGEGFRAPGADTPPDPALRLRRSVLDAVAEDAKRLQSRLGASDRLRLEQHLEGIRALERRLLKLEESPPALAACAVPAAPAADFPDADGRPPLSELNRAFVDVLAFALACDQVRVFSNWFTQSVSNVLFPGAPGGHHQLTHDELGDQPLVSKICLQITAEYAYLVERLRSIPEGDGTLLDHCVVLGTSDCSFGRTHSLEDFPILLAGTAGGALKAGVHYASATKENASRVMLTLLRAMDVPAASFGDGDAKAVDTLPGIEA